MCVGSFTHFSGDLQHEPCDPVRYRIGTGEAPYRLGRPALKIDTCGLAALPTTNKSAHEDIMLAQQVLSPPIPPYCQNDY